MDRMTRLPALVLLLAAGANRLPRTQVIMLDSNSFTHPGMVLNDVDGIGFTIKHPNSGDWGVG
jgi:hypothetical protein